MKLKGKVAIITGAGQGIGKAYAHRFAKEGAKVVVADVNEEKARLVANEIALQGPYAIFMQVDVSDEQSVQNMVEKVKKKFGRIDILVNNAAIFSTIKMKRFYEITKEEWEQLMSVNLTGTFLCSKAVAPIMMEQQYGRIVNISSGTVLMGRVDYLHYVTSKAGVVGMSRSMARELGDYNITVNTVAPGATYTEIPRETVTEEQKQAMLKMQSIKRPQVPADLEGAVVFLSSDDAAFITGQLIVVDGGMMMH